MCGVNYSSKQNGNGSEGSSLEVPANSAAPVIISQGHAHYSVAQLTDCLILGNIILITPGVSEGPLSLLPPVC